MATMEPPSKKVPQRQKGLRSTRSDRVEEMDRSPLLCQEVCDFLFRGIRPKLFIAMASMYGIFGCFFMVNCRYSIHSVFGMGAVRYEKTTCSKGYPQTHPHPRELGR